MASNLPSSVAQSLWLPAAGYMAPQNFGPPFPMQFRPLAPMPHGQPFIPPSATQQFHPVGQTQHVGLPPGQIQPPQFSQPMLLFLPQSSQPGQTTPTSYAQPSMPISSVTPQSQPTGPSPGVSYSSPYSFAPSFGQPQNSMNMTSQFQPAFQVSAPFGPTGGQPLLHSSQGASLVAPLQQTSQQPLVAGLTAATVSADNGLNTTQQTASDWQEYQAADGRRYFYNKVTKQSSWEKPLELMTPLERADASTVWKEFTTPEGRKYYYNKETKLSKWTIPDELKLAREEAEKEAAQGADTNSTEPAFSTGTSAERLSAAVTTVSSTNTTMFPVSSSPVPAASITDTIASPVMVSGSSATPTIHTASTSAAGVPLAGETVVPSPSNSTPVSNMESSSSNVETSRGGASFLDIEEAKKGMAVAGKINVTPVEERQLDDEPTVFANKQEAKNAFKALLESANVEADWSWEQAMRIIINDKRYAALKTLGERKQAFDEYLMQRKKLEAEERRLRQRKVKEEFTNMLEECEELTPSTRWSKAAAKFEGDERFKAVEREADREDLFRNYLVDLQKKEKAKAQEEHRRNRLEFRKFLETCAFIKVDSQWRKVQGLLEDDERCRRLDKIDRLDIFQEYISDLEKEDDEQKKRQKEQLKRAERKNRDEFRKMMEDHMASGTLTAKTHWLDYCKMVRDSEAYQAVASHTSGSTPKDLFEDFVEELEKKYEDDKASTKDMLKLEKITVASTWTIEDFKSFIEPSSGSFTISDINLQLIYEDLIERAKEKEEKEAKKRKRLAKDFTDKLSTIKEVNALSSWEECKQLVEDSSVYRSIGEENICREIFDDYISRLQEKAKGKERKRQEEKAKKEKERDKEKRKDRERIEKEREKEKEKDEKEKDEDREREKERDKVKEHLKNDEVESENIDITDGHGHRDNKRKEKDKERKHRKWRQIDDVSSDEDDKEKSKKSRRHGSDRKKSRKIYEYITHICLNQIARVGAKDTKENTGMVVLVFVITRSLKMVN
ncbi:pre-mRNA-processing protein 40A-like isoform X2 [Olea europaea var. sylvestris]|uniref:pre-mRNA-processing protein 40A-like isoform X2 n=1 Tax=Olea europaea var. sylvestris TaxID=158386 RepID=UPI000C1D0407|nr:pre-mRNA-processing protein 40A-like isoform X2 [Olea europaea var. sylvestris]